MTGVFIGTSGWQYRNWRGNFYRNDLPQKDWLKYYSQHFATVEVNSSFYRQTQTSTFEKWKSEVPSDFTFSIKGNRFITHIKRLKDCEESLKIFFDNLKPLATSYKLPTTHVILWQLPPSLKLDTDLLKGFIKFLPNNFRHTFEFRHNSWTQNDLKKLLPSKNHKFAVVLQDWKDWPIYDEPIGNFVYIRLHGKDQLYTSGYSEMELANWAEKVRKWVSKALDVYVYFNNDALGYATENATTLKKLI